MGGINGATAWKSGKEQFVWHLGLLSCIGENPDISWGDSVRSLWKVEVWEWRAEVVKKEEAEEPCAYWRTSLTLAITYSWNVWTTLGRLFWHSGQVSIYEDRCHMDRMTGWPQSLSAGADLKKIKCYVGFLFTLKAISNMNILWIFKRTLEILNHLRANC